MFVEMLSVKCYQHGNICMRCDLYWPNLMLELTLPSCDIGKSLYRTMEINWLRRNDVIKGKRLIVTGILYLDGELISLCVSQFNSHIRYDIFVVL